MGYQALYRKYRPSSFNDVSGQEVTVRILQNSIKNNKISHAYLFYGPRGTGKTSVAKIFARAVNCTDQNNGIQCEKCDNCLASKDKECVDIIEIDAASNNGVDEIRELKSKVSFLPASLKYKVYIIDEVHMLSTGAFNALLKTLEEPPEYVIFILATTELNKVPLTIVSRCQCLEFKKISNTCISNRLKYISDKESIKIDAAALVEIANNCNGGLRDSIGLLEKASAYTDDTITEETIREISGNISSNEFKELIGYIESKNIENFMKKIDSLYDSGIDLSKIVLYLLNYYSNLCFEDVYSNIDVRKYVKELDNLYTTMMTTTNQKLIFETNMLNIMLDESKNINIKANPNITTNDNPSVKVEKEIKEEKKEKPKTAKDNNEMSSLKQRRVYNTLAMAKKEYLQAIMKEWKSINDLAFDVDCGNVARILISDITPAVASDEYLVIKSKLNGIAEQLNGDLGTVEKILKKIFNKEYKTICISEKEWNEYIDLYKNDKSVFVYVKEEEKKQTKSLKDKAKELFDD